MDVNEGRIEVFGKIKKKIRGGCQVGGRVGGAVRVDVNEKLKFLGKLKKKNWGGGEGGGGVGSSRGVGNGVGVRVMVNEEFKFLGKFKKNLGGGSRGGGQVGGSGWWGGIGLGGVRVDVNEELN